jgi:hypothetical protein
LRGIIPAGQSRGVHLLAAYFPGEGWAVINGIITLILFALWHFFLNKKTGATAANYGVTWTEKRLDWGKIGKSLLLAICIVFAAYMLLAISDWLFKIDFRLWVVALKPMSSLHSKSSSAT